MASNNKRCTRMRLIRCAAGILLAGTLAVLTAGRAFDENLIRFTFGDTGVTEFDRGTLPWDLLFIAGYAGVLWCCARIFRTLVISRFGRLLADLILAALLVTVLADLTENGALWLVDDRRAWLRDVAGAAATVKWSAAIIASIAVPAAIAVLIRLWRSNICFVRRTTLFEGGEPKTETKWWDAVLEVAKAPTYTPAVKDLVIREQGSWAKAYRVPGANEVVDRRAGDGEPVTAICLSGGGVRSACVAMGATQEFAKNGHYEKKNLLDNVDYIISVSGGGYTSGARLLAVQPDPTSVDATAGPLKLSQRYSEGSLEFDYFRRHSSYIADSPGGLARALGEVLKNLTASLVGLFWVPVVVGFIAGLFYAWQPVAAFVPVPKDVGTDARYVLSSHGNTVAWWGVVAFVGIAVVLQVWALAAELARPTDKVEARRARLTKMASGAAVFAVTTLAVTYAVPGLMRLGYKWFLETPNAGAVGGGIAGVVGLQYLVAVAAMIWKKKSALAAGGGLSHLVKRLPRAVFQFTMIILTLTVLAALWLLVVGAVGAYVFQYAVLPGRVSFMQVPHAITWLVLIVAIALMLGIADATSLSLHPFYRARLARTFAVRRLRIDGLQRWKAERYADSEPTWLNTHGTVKTPDSAPQFVFAAAVPISGDEKPAPGLDAVSFVFTADHVGGPELGWLKTSELIRIAPPRIRRDLTVQAAVAVSGAAFASAMGRQSSWASTLLAVSGARLGTWLPNPFFVRRLADAMNVGATDTEERKTLRADMVSAKTATAERSEDTRSGDKLAVWPKGLPTMRGNGYFYRELLGLHKKGGRLVQVTDGGHYENLGLVEALRRRCQLIYCVDSSGDTPPLVSGLADAMRLAEYELGVTITLRARRIDKYILANLAPGSGAQFATTDGFASLNARVTREAVLVADITYPEAAGFPAGRNKGVLIVAKAVLWRECPSWLLTYAAEKANEIFPHDPTSDQWFNEGQFSAYTELGRLIGERAVEVGAVEYRNLKAGWATDKISTNGSRTAPVPT